MGALGDLITVIAIIVLYFLPTIIVATKVHREKTMVVAINFLLGWTIICWFISLYMALSRQGIEQKEANQALTVEALKGRHQEELREVRRKHRAQLEMVRSRPARQDDALAQRQAELDRLKTEYEERLAALTEQQRSLQQQGKEPSTTGPNRQPPAAEERSRTRASITKTCRSPETAPAPEVPARPVRVPGRGPLRRCPQPVRTRSRRNARTSPR